MTLSTSEVASWCSRASESSRFSLAVSSLSPACCLLLRREVGALRLFVALRAVEEWRFCIREPVQINPLQIEYRQLNARRNLTRFPDTGQRTTCRNVSGPAMLRNGPASLVGHNGPWSKPEMIVGIWHGRSPPSGRQTRQLSAQ